MQVLEHEALVERIAALESRIKTLELNLEATSRASSAQHVDILGRLIKLEVLLSGADGQNGIRGNLKDIGQQVKVIGWIIAALIGIDGVLKLTGIGG